MPLTPRATCPQCSWALPHPLPPACPHCGQVLDAAVQPAQPYTMPPVGYMPPPPPPAIAGRAAYPLQAEHEHAAQLREALALVIPGETLYAVLPEGHEAAAYVAFTDRRLIFLDQGQLGGERRVVSLPFSQITLLAFAADAGTTFAASRLAVQASTYQWTFISAAWSRPTGPIT